MRPTALAPRARAIRGPRLFATPVDEPRARRATDAILLVAGALGLALLSWVSSPPAGFERALTDLVAAVPSFLGGLWRLFVGVLGVLSAVLVVAALVRGRLTLARDQVVAAVVALGTAAVAARLAGGAWPDLDLSMRADTPPPTYPGVRLAVAGAIVMTASPHLARPVRRLGRWSLALAAVGLVVLGATSPAGALAGLLVAVVAASIVHLVFGSSAGRPSLEQVAAALAELGVPATGVGAADRQAAGVFLVQAEDAEGRPLAVKVYGRDAFDSQLLATLWRTVWFREPGSSLTVHRLQQVEHEAFLTLLAGQAGIPTDQVVTAGSTVEDDALLVLRPRGVPLASALADDPDLWPPGELVRRAWEVVGRLHGAGIVHGQLDDRHLTVVDGELGLVEFRGAAVGPSEAQEQADIAQVLVTTALLVGVEPALQGALEALGADGLTAAVPYLQPPALTGAQRDRLKGSAVTLDDLRARASELAGVEAPKLQQLRRVTWGGILQVALLAFVFFTVLTAVDRLDMDQLFEQLADATWQWVVVGFVVGQLPRLSQAASTLGASPITLPLGHLYALQLAVSYINLAIPSSAARMAVNVRFFQRHGLPAGSALAVGVIDGVSGFVVQVSLLVGILTLTDATLGFDLDLGLLDGPGQLLLYVLVAVGLVVVVAAAIGRVRRFVVRWAKTIASQAASAARGLRSPRRIGLLIGGNLATEVLFALTLGAFTRALGYPVGLDDLLLINLSVALLSGLLPVPGGIGVTEAGLAFGLISVGMPEEAAFAAVILHRLAVFYLPPVWGFFAFRWLERNDHL